MSHRFSRSYRTFLFLAMVVCLSAVSCFKDLPKKTVVYQNDFENDHSSNFKFYNISGKIDSGFVNSFHGSHVLGRFNNTLVQLHLDSLPEHNTIKIEFDLYIHDQWDGDYSPPGAGGVPDVWQMMLDGYQIYLTTFSNTSHKQSFPDNFNPSGSVNPPHSNAWALLPGVCALGNREDGTSHYKIEYITAHTSSSLLLSCNDALQPYNSLCLKSWSLDNIRISANKY